MDHTGNLPFVFRLDGDAVASVAHGDHGILQIGAGASADQAGELGVNAVVGDLHVPAHAAQSGTGVVADLIFRKNAAADLPGQGSERSQVLEHGVQRIGGSVAAFLPSVGLHSGGVLQKTAYSQDLRDAERAADLQALQGTADILHAAERNASLLEKPGQRVSGLHLEKPDLLDIVGWRHVPANL